MTSPGSEEGVEVSVIPKLVGTQGLRTSLYALRAHNMSSSEGDTLHRDGIPRNEEN